MAESAKLMEPALNANARMDGKRKGVPPKVTIKT